MFYFKFFNSNYELNSNFSQNPFILQKINNSFYSINSFRNLWKSKRKKKEMENANFSYDGIKKAQEVCFTLPRENLDLLKNIIEQEKRIILDQLSFSGINEYFIELNKLINKNSDLFKINSYFKKKNLNKKSDNTFEKMLSFFSKIISFHFLSLDIFDKKIYLPAFMDNRGRQYYNSIISPTFNKLYRYLYEFNEKKKFINLENSIFYQKILKYKKLIKNKNLDDRQKYVLLVMYIEIGKLFVKKKTIVKTENIIKSGIENYLNKNFKLKFEENLYLKKIYKFLDNFHIYGVIDENFIIFKDATSSGLQNYGILSGYKLSKLKYLNLNGENWCDTYSYLIKKYLKTSDKSLYERRYWKKTIMTIPYNCEWYQSFIYFLSELRKDGVYYEKLTKDKQDDLKKIHKNFNEKIKNKLKSEFYENKIKKKLKEFKYNKWLIVSKNEYKINYKNKRDKYTDTLYMLISDEETTIRASEANNMHSLDSDLLIYIISQLEVIGIHDCFGVRLCELHTLIDNVNKYYSNEIGADCYSIFVLI